ncbi:protease modulator HflC [Hirschia litorea]|uniref:Protein HflC n=1 Tax=Hirschia litorea TaxID=1199156 RepID=A0ABW2ILQ7_9PROT
MGKILGPFALILVGLGAIIAFNSFYIVRVDEQAILLQLGQAQGVINAPKRASSAAAEDGAVIEYDNLDKADSEAGLHFKVPFLQNVAIFDKKNLGFELPSQEIIAADQERLIVDAFARWKIVDPLQFFRSANNEAGATAQLQGIMTAALREVLGDVKTPDIISGQRAELMTAIRDILNRGAEQYGIEIVDVRITRADLPRANSERVFTRMQTERNQEAAQIRAEGEEQGLRIRAEADRNATVLLAEAKEQSEIIKGDGDAKRNAIYAGAYNLDPEFFSFYRSMDAYKAGVKAGTPMVLSPDSDFFGYFSNKDGKK